MMFVPALRRFCLLITLFSVTVLAQSGTPGNDCDWNCLLQRISTLEKQVEKLTALLYPTNPTVNRPPPTQDYDSALPSSYSSSFGTPYVASTYYPIPSSLSPVVPTSTSDRLPVAPTYTPPSPAASASPSRDGYRSVAYFGNWDIYARKYFPQNIPAQKLTHLLYSFADNKEDGTVFFTDTYADTEIHYPGDSWSESGKNVYGAVKQLALLKKQNRNLKVILSVGGWTYTNTNKHMDSPASTAAGRKTFADSCVDLIRNYGFDGIDIDWEYPQNPTQGAQLLALLQEIRQAMDAYADTLIYEDGHGLEERPHFELSIAAPAGENNYKNLPLRDIANVLDYVNLMAYDYAGSWDQVTGHAQNLYPSRSNPQSTPFNTYGVVNAYLAAGVPATKMNLGMPLYGRAFTNTAGLGQSYSGIGPGTWEAGVYDWQDLPLPGAQVYYDAEAGATYSYDNSTGMLVSFDTVDMALKKVDYIKNTGLGGAMWWEVSGDRQDDTGIISNVVKALGGADGRGMEYKPNWVDYPDSEYKNLAGGFAG